MCVVGLPLDEDDVGCVGGGDVPAGSTGCAGALIVVGAVSVGGDCEAAVVDGADDASGVVDSVLVEVVEEVVCVVDGVC